MGNEKEIKEEFYLLDVPLTDYMKSDYKTLAEYILNEDGNYHLAWTWIQYHDFKKNQYKIDGIKTIKVKVPLINNRL